MVVAGPTVMHQHLGMRRPGNRASRRRKGGADQFLKRDSGREDQDQVFAVPLFSANYLVYNQ